MVLDLCSVVFYAFSFVIYILFLVYLVYILPVICPVTTVLVLLNVIYRHCNSHNPICCTPSCNCRSQVQTTESNVLPGTMPSVTPFGDR